MKDGVQLFVVLRKEFCVVGVLCHLLLGETPVILEGTIVHRQYTVNPHQIRYYYGVQFRDPDMRTQDIIVNHVFRLMRRERKK